VNAGSINATTLDLTNLEVTNIKAKDGTTSMSIADSTGIVTMARSLVVDSTTDSTSATTGSIQTDGGVGIAKSLFVGGVLDVTNTTESTSITTGSVVIDGGVGIAKNLVVGGDVTVTKNTSGTFLRLQSLAPYSFPGDFTFQAGGQSTPALTIRDNTAAQDRLNIYTGETVFNEAGADQDFRIESDTEGNMFFLDAGNNRIGFKTNTPVSYLTVGGAFDQFLTFQDFRTNTTGTYDSYMAWQTFGTTPLLLGFTQNDFNNANRRFFIKYSGDNTPTYQERLGIAFTETVFNEGSFDVDFRVESDTNTHMLFVDASSNVVSIGSSATNAWSTYIPLQIGSSTFVTDTGAGATFSQFVHGAIFNGATWNQLYTDVTASRIELSGISTGSIQNFYTATNVTAGTATTQILNLTLSPTASVFNEDSRDIDFRVESDGNGHMLFVDAGNNRVVVGNPQFGVSTTAFQVSNIAVTDTGSAHHILIGNQDSGGTNTPSMIRGVNGTLHLGWGNDWTSATGGTMTQAFSVVGTSPSVVVNDDGADIDFRVESDTNTHMLFVDAGNNRVGIANGSPTQALDVTGNILASASVIATSDLYVGGTGVNVIPALDRGVYLQGTTNNTVIGYGISIQEGSNNRRGSMFLNDSTGVWGFDATASSGVPVYKFYRAGNEYFGIGDEIVANDNGYDLDFRVESDTSTHMLFVDAGANTVNINTSSTNNGAKLGVYAASGINQVNWGVNGNSQGNPQFAKVVRWVSSAGSSNKLIIPFLSQGSLNSTTVCRVMGHNAQFNTSSPQAIDFTFAVGHLNALYSLASWGTGGNFSSIAINGMNVEISLGGGYGAVYGEPGGMFITLEYMSNNLFYSIQPDSIVMA
jgi:hypothetical protein